MSWPRQRPRRLRATPAMRRLVAQTSLEPRHLVLPMFVAEGISESQPIRSMPGVVQHTRDSLRSAAADAVAAGVGGLMLFGVPRDQDKDAVGSAGTDPDGILNVALRDLAKDLGDATVLMADTCLDEFTDHGHCGVLDERGRVDNDATVDRYVELAVAQARAGAHVVGPSGMMDGQVGAIRDGLDAAGYTDVVILAYAAKFASAFYGPFREAVSCSLSGDRRTYQQEPGNAREALREIQLDLDEGADIVMVKPAMGYLDIVSAAAANSPVPVAAYQVSGEYAMICAAAAHNWIDERAAALESLTSIRRAGPISCSATGPPKRRVGFRDGGFDDIIGGHQIQAVVLRTRRQLVLAVGRSDRGGVDDFDRNVRRRRGWAGDAGDFPGDGVGVRGGASEGGAYPHLRGTHRRRVATGHRDHPGVRDREGVSRAGEFGGIGQAVGQVAVGAGARRTGRGAAGPGGHRSEAHRGRTAQAWARRHRHLRAALTPLVTERVEPVQMDVDDDDTGSAR
ncbi:delta-aminolevulinic acid dehydratase family protein [Mycobacterium kansasii]|uniref:Delta-aminolevulinic acid dehydratase n=1 Tax=Mycobacterium kansasii TaxID=1768 RepID=A0A1V3WQR9_MYCKA|nr:delta-aminolevulinic acid dehydratase family protein [Mycobacterium kansasii]